MELNKKSIYGVPAAEELFIAPHPRAAVSGKAAAVPASLDQAREARIARRVRCIKAMEKIPGRRAEAVKIKEPSRRA